jgi:hypothetical protein
MLRVVMSGVLAMLSSCLPAAAQSLTGTSGLVSIPTATIAADGRLTAGVNVIPARYHGYYDAGYDETAVVRYVAVGFLPFVEVGLRLTHVTAEIPQGLGDRMVSVRVRLLTEGTVRPALAVGAHDLVGTRLYHATYAVASRTVRTPAGPAGVHAGYGHNVLGLETRGRQFDGLFGGASLAPVQWLTLLAEYDGEHANAGVRVGPVHGVALVVGALRDLDGVSAGLSYTFALR